jgi:hypothetical protein
MRYRIKTAVVFSFERHTRTQRLLRFIAGLAVLSLAVALLASGYTPPGICGEVLRHNQTHEIDASALFYTEVENMSELEAGLAELRQAHAQEDQRPESPALNTTR